jgi:septum formation protein
MVITVRPIVLASSSRYRRELLERLRVPFSVDRPDVDESAQPGEAPASIALRLARTKAHAVELRHAGALIIGSDQVADVDGLVIGKPGAFDVAMEQLQRMQGRIVVFHTAIAVLDTISGAVQIDNVPTQVRFRNLPRAALEAYLNIDTPFDCAGAAKIESAGIALVESVESADPTALIGLPLIRLTTMLTVCGIDVPPR